MLDPTTVISWWLRFLRDALIALVSTYAIYCSGLLLGLGVLIVFDVPGSEKFTRNHVPYVILAVSIILFLTGRFLHGSGKIPVRVSGGALIIFAASLLGAWIGLEVQNFTVEHGVEDLGLYGGPGQAAVIALAVMLYRSTNGAVSRVGSVMIVLGSALVIGFLCDSIHYSQVVASLHLTTGQMHLLFRLRLAPVLLGSAAAAALLIRRSDHPAL